MFIFWVCIASLITIALTILLLPLIHTPKIFASTLREKTNVNLYEENLSQLKVDLSQNKISQKQFEESHLTLQKNLLEDVAQNSESIFNSDSTKFNWKNIVFLFVALPLFSITFYLYNGNSQLLTKWYTVQNEALAINKMRAALGTPQQVIATLKQHLARNPQSAEGWYLLGRLYFTQQQYKDAVNAFEKSYQLNPKNPDTLFQYAQTLYLTQHTLSGKPTLLLQQLLKLQAHNPLAINLLAVANFNDKHYSKAIKYWEELLPLYSPDSADGKALLSAIARAQKRERN